MDDTQRKQKNVLDMARKKNEERLQPSHGNQQIMKDAKLQNQKRLQPSSNYQQELENARKSNEERQQPNLSHQQTMKNAETQNQKRQQPNLGSKKSGRTRKKTLNPFSVLKQVDFLKDVPFFCAFGFAILKDILDIVFALTGVLIILSMLLSILCSIFIFMMLLLTGSSGKQGVAKGLAKKGLSIIGGGLIDLIPGLSILPAATITVGIVYFMTLSERASAEK